MRVLHVVRSLNPNNGGPAQSVPALCRALHHTGVEVSLYTLRPEGAQITIEPSLEPFSVKWFSPFPGSLYVPSYSFYRSIRKDLDQFDLVHLNGIWNPAISLVASICRARDKPYVISSRGMLQQQASRHRWWKKRAYYLLWERHTLTGARAIHFFTEAEAEDSRPMLNGISSRVVIPNGIDPAVTMGVIPGAFRQAYPELKYKKILLFLGRIHWSKGLELQADALAQVVKESPDVVWVLIGPDDGAWPALSKQLADLGLDKQVLWTGLMPRKTCLDALADADVCLLTSRHEAHSVAMNEALAVGTPLVITDTVQFEAVQQWGAGVVTPRDPDCLAAAIIDILTHPDKAQRMRDRGRRMAQEYLAWPKVAQTMVQTYREILSG